MRFSSMMTALSLLVSGVASAQEAPQVEPALTPTATSQDADKLIEQAKGDQTVVLPTKEVSDLPAKEATPNGSLPEVAMNPVAPATETITIVSAGTTTVKDGMTVSIPPTTIQVPVVVKPVEQPPKKDNKWLFGFGLDFGAPSGITAGFVVNPKLDWLAVEASFAYIIAPGGRLSVQLDPFAAAWHNLPIGLFADLQGGFFARGQIPVDSSKLPSVGYDYINLYGGLRFGKMTGFHWFFEAGPSYMHVSTSDFAKVVGSSGSLPKGLSVGNPSANAWVTPTGITGFRVVW